MIRSIGLPGTFVWALLAGGLSPARTQDSTPRDVLEGLRAGHPRLYLTAPKVEALRKGDLGRLRSDADRWLRLPPTDYPGGDLESRVTAARRVKSVAQSLGLAYLVTGEEKYALRGIQELKAAVAFPEWGRSGGTVSDLSVGEMSQGMALGYDWLYAAMSPEDRGLLRAAFRRKALDRTLELFRKKTYWTIEQSNWNPVCNCGAAMGALALAEEEPDLARALLEESLKSIAHGLTEFGIDGSFREGPGYWEYSTTALGHYFAVLQSALGRTPGLEAYPGFARTGLFPIYSSGPTGRTFNFADAHEGTLSGVTVLNWLAETFHEPVYAGFLQKFPRVRGSFEEFLWPSRPGSTPAQAGLPLDKHFRGDDLVFLRGSWEDPQAVWIGFKGGDSTVGHSHLDMGGFVLEALGERWAIDLGMGDYRWPGYWSVGGPRWEYYRVNTHGHNTIVLDGQNQKYGARAPIVAFWTTPEDAGTVADLTALYPQARSLRRGVRLLGRRRVLVQDELQADRAVRVQWGMHTRAAVELAGTRAVLSLGGKTLEAEVLEPEGARFDVANVDDQNNAPRSPSLGQYTPGVQKLSIRLPEEVASLRLRVLFRPGGDPPVPAEPRSEPLGSWPGWDAPTLPPSPKR
ncbi:MAG TPA: heparinase II/III family protein [Planctomycetota bacterium]|nr:heparinase II/III family protein [Planctomycetota bacterium]